MRNIVIAGILMILFGCNSKSNDGYITVKVQGVEQVGIYTYLLVKEKGNEYWIAVSSMDAKPGEVYRYKGGLSMKDFYSKELDRTFEEVLFLDEIFAESGELPAEPEDVTPGSMVKIEKSNVEIEATEGTTSIAELYANPKSFKGKKVTVKGEVTKFNTAIMDRNWAHLQDGTEHNGKFDLTITSAETFEVGSIVIVEGILVTDQDFGYGYSYELLLEKATAVK